MSVQWSLRSRVFLALTFVALVVAATAAQDPAGRAQGAGAARGGGAGRGRGPTFTGTTAFQPTEGQSMSRIRFEAGARTYWHVHKTGQLLLIEDGRGRWQEQGGVVQEILQNQPVYTKPNVPHWHGAAPDSHAVQFSVYGAGLEWQQAVTDDEYLGKKR